MTDLTEVIFGGGRRAGAVVRLWAGGGRGTHTVSVFFSLNILPSGEVSLRRGVTDGKKVRVVKLAKTR